MYRIWVHERPSLWLAPVWQSLSARFVAARMAVQTLLDRQRQRDALGRLDARLLRDVGITVAQAQAESTKPIWRD